MLSLLVVLVARLVITDAAGCTVFANHFRVIDGVFSDICGGVQLTASKGALTSSDNTLSTAMDQVVSLSPLIVLTDASWAVVFEGQSQPTFSTSPTNLLLGPIDDSTDSQIEFADNDNAVCIESTSANFSHCIPLPYSITEPHTLILFHSDQQLTVYQNGETVQTIDLANALEFEFGRIGPATLKIESLRFAQNVPIDDIETYINTCEQFADYDAAQISTVDSGTVYVVSESQAEEASCGASMTLMFFAGMWTMALLNLLCFGVHKYLKKRGRKTSTGTARHVSVSVHDNDHDADTDLSDTDESGKRREDIDDGVEETQMSSIADEGLRKHSEQMALKNLTPIESPTITNFNQMPTITSTIATHATDESL